MKKITILLFTCLCLALCSACKKTSPDKLTNQDAHTLKRALNGSADANFTIETFTNPLIPRGADPWVAQKNGMYYFTYTQGGKLVLYKTSAMTELALATAHDAWIPPQGMPYSKNIWAPELHEIDNKWYLYFAADNGTNANHRIYVVENSSNDPTQGTWVFKGKVADSTDQWAIDGTVFNNSRLAIRLIDNDPSTPWIARYSAPATNYPDHWIAVDMGDTLSIDGLAFTQKDGDRKIKQLQILVGNDNQTWEDLGIMELLNVYPNKQYFNLPARKQFRYFKLVPVSGLDSQPQPGLAEAGAFLLDN